ncbi:TraB/VirB10 family protein [Thioalkalivibrio sp. ALMg11]|uniref:TraB/VirB10 family protein n=1 Tax=Thioalkalivibrio sp. ALMg11 TaxID=1158165 RepID=UPI00037B6632|nr:TraB/VirB10 family protein [Thioalkalivibrio sp. ALMg11]
MAKDVNVRDPAAVLKRQKMMLYGGGGALFLAVLGLIAVSESGGDGDRPDPVVVERTDIRSGGESLTDSEIWVARSEAVLGDLQDSIRSLEGQLARMERDNERLRDDLDEARDRVAESTAVRGGGGDPFAIDSPFVPPPPPSPDNLEADPEPDTAERGVVPPPPPGSRREGGGEERADRPREPDVVRGIARVSLGDPRREAREAREQEEAEQREQEEAGSRNVGTYIPSGSFVRANIIGGIDAPTGGTAQGDPHPLLMRLSDNSILPNRFRGKVKECFMTGAGYGDISSERAYVRVESLSCVLPDGSVIDQSVDAYVVGEDGKAGIRGRLVSKQGQLIARALMAGIVGGIGEGFSQASTTLRTTGTGTTRDVDPGDVLEYGTASGVGSAMERLADYYVQAAEQTYPVIEVPAGRDVSVVFLRGAELDGNVNNAGREAGFEPIVTDEDRALARTGVRSRVNVR